MKGSLKMNSKLVNRLLLALIVLLIAGSIVGANTVVKMLGGQANKLVGLKAHSSALSIEQSNLMVDKKEVAKYSSLEQVAESIVPQDKDQAETVREIVNMATQNNITLTSIIFPSSTLGTSTTPSTKAPTVSLSQLTPVKGMPGIYSLPIEVEDNQPNDAVSYASFYNFLSMLEQNRRTSQVTGLTIQPVPKTNGLISFTLTINEYIKPL